VDIKSLAEVGSLIDIENRIDIKSLMEVECYSTSLYILVLGYILILDLKL
jgi:hypothetical protein